MSRNLLQFLACAWLALSPPAAQASTVIAGLFEPIGAKDVSELQRFSVSSEGLQALQAAKSAVTLQSVPLPEGLLNLSLEPFSPFSDDARVLLNSGRSETVVPLPSARYFRGITAQGAAVFLRVSNEGELFAMFAGAGATSSVLKSEGGEGFSRRANTDETEAYCPGGIAIDQETREVPWLRRMDKVVLSEYRLLVDMENRLLRSVFKGDVGAAVDYVADIFGVVSAVYLRDAAFSLKVSDLVIWTEPAPFELSLEDAPSYDDTLNAYRLFDATRVGYSRNLSHLLTLRLPSYGSTIGLAFVGALCSNSFKQGSSSLNGRATAFDPNTTEQDPVIVAHEIGHNFGCSHTNSSSIMDTTFSTSVNFTFDNVSKAQILNGINSAPCSESLPEQCAPDSLFGQRPVNTEVAFGIGYISDSTAANLTVLDDFAAVSEPIGGIRWWAYPQGCLRSPENVTITFFADDAGAPGSEVASFNLTASPLDTDFTLAGSSLLRYEVEFETPLVLETGWVSIVGTGDNLCAFRWASNNTGTANHIEIDGINQTIEDGNAAFCLLSVKESSPFDGLDCAPGALFSNPLRVDFPIPANLLISNEGTQTFFELFSGVAEPIVTVQWWGAELNASNLDCSRTPNEFEIQFLPPGSPLASPVASFTAVPLREEVEMETSPTVARYTFDLPEPLALEAGILIIRGVGDTECQFSWSLGESGNNQFLFFTTGPGVSGFANVDGSFCLIGEVLAEGEGEGTPEGVFEGEGAVEGNEEGDGTTEGQFEGAADGEGAVEGEGEGQALDPFEQLLYSFASTDTNSNSRVTLEEILFQFPGFTQQELDSADANGDGELTVAELLAVSPVRVVHSADSNGNFLLSLEELLRMIQLYNAGDYACAENPGASEDGYEARAPQGGDPVCLVHALDLNGDRRLSLGELLRGIQLFNLSGYQFCAEQQPEDGFCRRPGD